VRCLYEGDHGQVWEVIDDEDGGHYALKYVTASSDPAIIAGLLHEGHLHSLLRHAGIARLHDIVDSKEGHQGLVMELIPGPSLAELLDRKGAPTFPNALIIFEEVVRAVRAAHFKGVVHRDIKPENIVLRRVDGKLQPVLIDFGLAKQLSQDGVASPKAGMSLWFTTLGTPEYMAPEQADAPGAVDERADVFSLGCLLYELLTGRVAFDAEDPDVAREAVRTGKYVPPEQIVDLPKGLASLVHDLLAAAPADRPSHCTAILRRLDGSHHE
jgi:eukaryotic-like serine/threonine-protein kinase